MQIKDLDWKGIAEGVAKLGLPLLGTAIGGPAGAAVGAALASAIPGGDKIQTPQDMVQVLTSSAEALQKAKEFEATHQEHLLQLSTQFQMASFQAEVDDRNSARQREIQLDQSNTAPMLSKLITPILALGIIGLTFIMFGTLAYLTDGDVNQGQKEVIIYILGALTALASQVVAYYFGSSRGDAVKAQQLSDVIKKI